MRGRAHQGGISTRDMVAELRESERERAAKLVEAERDALQRRQGKAGDVITISSTITHLTRLAEQIRSGDDG